MLFVFSESGAYVADAAKRLSLSALAVCFFLLEFK